MKRNSFAIVVTAVCILFSGYAYADVFHPEDANIRGHIGQYGDDVCFNNDGSTDPSTCPDNGGPPNEGYVYARALDGDWKSQSEGINGCGITAADPVSSATCPLVVDGTIATCTPNQYVLVQTLISGHYFAIKAGTDCGDFIRPEVKVIFPCRATDSFDPVLGCTGVANQSGFRVEGGYIQLETSTVPPVEHCNDVTHEGRMIVDSVNDLLYICTQSGWITK